MNLEPKIPEALISKVKGARSVVILTGAGVSAESGVPTFRDAEKGLWADFKPEEVATLEAFRRNPQKVWDWYAQRRGQLGQVEPNAGHRALVELEREVPSFTLVTQNIDDLHRKAGNKHIIELHGNLLKNKCLEENTPVESWEENGRVPPRCPRCGGMIRPDVVWFGEMLPVDAFRNAVEATQNCDLFFSIGTSAVVEPAASLPYEALRCGATVVEVNPEETELTSQASFFLRGPAGKILPALLEDLKKTQ